MNTKVYIAIFFFSIESKGERKRNFNEVILPGIVHKICGEHQIILKKTPLGKPGFIQPKGWFYNISHSRNIGVCAIAQKNLGIDLEFIKSNRDVSAIAETWYSNNEISYLKELSAKKEEKFYHLWTRKESFIKKLGKSVWNMKKMPDMSIGRNSEKTWIVRKGSESFSLSLAVDIAQYSEPEVEFYYDYFKEKIALDTISFSDETLTRLN